MPSRTRRRRPVNQSTQAGQETGWSRFDLGRSAQLLNSLNPGTVNRELRRLHLRWYHAPAKQMHNTLKLLGVRQSTLKMINQIVDTCNVCRKLQAPGHKTISTSRVVTDFNDVVQHDIMFVHRHPVILEAEGGSEDPATIRRIGGAEEAPGVETARAFPTVEIPEIDSIRAYPGVDVELQTEGSSSASGSLNPVLQGRSGKEKEAEKKKFKDLVAWQHMIDCATRLTQAQIIPNRETQTLLDGAYDQWFKFYGFPRTLETDQESGLLSIRAKEWCQNRNINLKERPKHGHAQLVERHHRVLRETYLKIMWQCEQEGIPITMKEALAEAVIVKNSMITIHGYTPTQAVFGTSSPLMPDLSRGDASIANHPDRHRQRVREIAIHSIVQASTEERLRRTQLSNTRLSTRASGIVVGDIVEFWRQPEHKEVSGWKGPAEVAHVDHEGGIINVKWQGRILLCRPQDVRKSLLSWLVHGSQIFYNSESPLLEIVWFVNNLQDNTRLYIGFQHTPKGGWVLSEATRRDSHHMSVLNDTLRAAACEFRLTDCVGAIYHCNQVKITSPRNFWSFVYYWVPFCQPYYTTLGPGQTTKIDDDPRDLRCIQFLHTHPKHRETLQEEYPHIPHLGKVSIPTDWKEQRTLPFQTPIRFPAPKEPAARTPHNTSLMRPKPKNPPVAKPKPSIGILEAPSISIPQQATNHPSKSGFPKVAMPKFPWGCSRRPTRKGDGTSSKSPTRLERLRSLVQPSQLKSPPPKAHSQSTQTTVELPAIQLTPTYGENSPPLPAPFSGWPFAGSPQSPPPSHPPPPQSVPNVSAILEEQEADGIDSWPNWDWDQEDIQNELQQNSYNDHTPTEVASSTGNTLPYDESDPQFINPSEEF